MKEWWSLYLERCLINTLYENRARRQKLRSSETENHLLEVIIITKVIMTSCVMFLCTKCCSFRTAVLEWTRKEKFKKYSKKVYFVIHSSLVSSVFCSREKVFSWNRRIEEFCSWENSLIIEYLKCLMLLQQQDTFMLFVYWRTFDIHLDTSCALQFFILNIFLRISLLHCILSLR
jgi:hypothetical protein